MNLIDGKKIAAELRNELKVEVDGIKKKFNKVPGLTVILIGDLAPSQIYVRNKEKSAKRIKEAKFRPRIEEHDYITKVRRSEKFLHQGNKLKITLMFRGREMEHIDLGMDLIKQAIEDLSSVGKVDDQPKLNGRFIIVTLSPLPKNQRTLRFNSLEDLETDEPDDASEEPEDSAVKEVETSEYGK